MWLWGRRRGAIDTGPSLRAFTFHLCADGPHISSSRREPSAPTPGSINSPRKLAGPGADAWSLLSLNPTGREGVALLSLLSYPTSSSPASPVGYTVRIRPESTASHLPACPHLSPGSRNSPLGALCCAPHRPGDPFKPKAEGMSPCAEPPGRPSCRLKASVLTTALLIWLQLLCDNKPLACPSPNPGLLPRTC